MKEAILVLLLGLAAVGLWLGVSSTISDHGDQQDWLFLQSASSGTYDGSRLTLDGVVHTVAFTDRPAREVTHVTNDAFARAWDAGANSFADDPPNAALAYDVGDATGHAILELDGIEVEGDSVSYAVAVLEGDLPIGPFDQTSLVIDPLGAIFPSDQNGHSDSNDS